MPITNMETYLWQIFYICAGIAIFIFLLYVVYQKITTKKQPIEELPIETLKPVIEDNPSIVKKETSANLERIMQLGGQEKKKIGEILLAHKLITQEVLDQALGHQKQYGGNITQYLLHYGHIDEHQLAHCLCSQFGVPYLPLESYNIPEEIIKLIPTDIAEKYWVLPVDKQGDVLTVVMIDPLDAHVIKELEKITGLKIIPYVGIISEILSSLRSYYKLLLKNKDIKIPSFFIETKTYVGAERRASIRFKCSIDIRFPLEQQYIKSQTIDVSRDGYSFECAQELCLGSYLTLQIDLPPEVHAFPIAVVVQVVRCIPRENQCFEIGVKTLKISKEENSRIINYAMEMVKKVEV